MGCGVWPHRDSSYVTIQSTQCIISSRHRKTKKKRNLICRVYIHFRRTPGTPFTFPSSNHLEGGHIQAINEAVLSCMFAASAQHSALVAPKQNPEIIPAMNTHAVCHEDVYSHYVIYIHTTPASLPITTGHHDNIIMLLLHLSWPCPQRNDDWW